MPDERGLVGVDIKVLMVIFLLSLMYMNTYYVLDIYYIFYHFFIEKSRGKRN